MGKHSFFKVWSALVGATSFLTITVARQAPSLRHITAGALFDVPVALLQSQWGGLPYVEVEGRQMPDGTLRFYFGGMPESNEENTGNVEGTGTEEGGGTGTVEGTGPELSTGTEESTSQVEPTGPEEGLGTEVGTGTEEKTGAVEGTGAELSTSTDESTSQVEPTGPEEGLGTELGTGTEEKTGTVEGTGPELSTGTDESTSKGEPTGPEEGLGTEVGTGTGENTGALEGTGAEGTTSAEETTGTEENTGLENVPAPDCASRGWKYGDVPFSVADASNATECQQQCQDSSACEAFAFDASRNKCELHLADGEARKHSDKSFISGPRYCGQCHEMNTDYDGEVLQKGASRVTSADECQLRCQATSKCEYWSFSGDGCKLVASGQSKSSAGHVSGPKYCEESCDILRHHAPRKQIGYFAKFTNKNLHQCRETCRATEGCSNFTIWQNGDCYLKENITLRSLEPRELATTGMPSCSTCFRQGVGYAAKSSNSLWNLQAVNSEECRARCDLMEQCTLFTYNARNKTCLMLSGDAGEEQDENLVSGPARCNADVSCFLQDVRFEGGESINQTQASGPAECQALCARHAQCKFFSFDGASCHLKGGESGVTSSHVQGWVSGNKKCATTEDLCYENNMNYPSADIPVGEIAATSAEGCRVACYKEPACRVWTYEVQNRVCRLKTIEAFSGRTRSNNMASGGRMGCARCLREGIAYNGELVGLINGLPSETQCQLSCEAEPNCKFFTFISDGNHRQCQLMGSMGSVQTADMRTTMSGPKRC